MAVDEGFSRLGRTATREIFKEVPNQKFLYVGPLDGKTREECYNVLVNQGDGLTSAQIDRLDGVSFSDGGGWGCRHQWVPV